jgi:SAM-dependent methyltransferase
VVQQPATFDTYKDTYTAEVQEAIGFAGQDVAFFTRAKAEHLLRLVRSHVGDPRRLRGLDIGCGIGLTDHYLQQRFAFLHGVDVSEGCLQVAARTNPTVDYRAYDGTSLPFPDNAFDVSFAICVMHHVPPVHWEQFTREMRRVTRPGGLAVVFEHNPVNPLTRLAVWRCPFDADAVLLNMRTTSSLCQRAGFSIVERRYILFFPWKRRWLTSLESCLRRLPLGGQYYVACR